MTALPIRRAVRQRGFTLLEILVVLVLVGLISTLLLQGLQHVFRLQEHFGPEYFRTRQGAMQVAWFRQAVNGLLPDAPEGEHKFRGGTRQFEGLTLAPLEAPGTSLSAITLRLRYDASLGVTRLEYGVPEKDAPVLMSWRGDTGAFVYVDGNGDDHDEWPPFLGQWPQLPSAIRLEFREADAVDIVAATRGPTTPAWRLRDAAKL